MKEREERIKIVKGDITEQKTDAIVNPANENLILGGGVAGAIRRKGGPQIQKECFQKAPIPTGSATITTAGNLPAKYVIHAVGPIWSQYSPEKADQLLKNAILSILKIAQQYNLSSIALPAISTGIFGFPKKRAAKIILTTLKDSMETIKTLQQVYVVLYTEQDYKIFKEVFETLRKKNTP